MTHRAPHPTHLQSITGRSGRWWSFAIAAWLSLVCTTNAPAQVVVGGSRPPSVSVDLTVLDQLGTAPNLPQLFGASRPSPGVAAAPPLAHPVPQAKGAENAFVTAPGKSKHLATRTTQRKPKPSSTRVAKNRDRSIHLVPPATASTGGPRVAPAIQPASVAVDSPVPPPAPMPKLPQASEAPPPPALGPSPAHEEPPAASQPTPPPQHANDAPVPLTATAAPPSSPPVAAPAAPTPAVPSPAAAAPAASSAPAPVQVASAAGTGAIANTVKFATGATDLPAGSRSVLDAVAGKLLSDDTLRIQLVAHATGTADQAMEARRISLARAVAVRAYLIDKGVRSLRMDVRALGNRADDGPATDRVDLLLISQ